MASYDKSKGEDYTLAVQAALRTLGADLGAPGIDGKWGEYTERAYQQNKSAVDALVGGMGGNVPALSVVQVDVPEQKSFDEWLSIGDALFAAQAEAQQRSAQRRLEYSTQQVEENRAQSAATLENAANARGFGRSSYTTDMLQKNENTAQKNNAYLLDSFNDALLEIEANRAANAAEYAGSMWQTQQDAVMKAQQFNAQMQNEANLKQWEQQLAQQQKLQETYAATAEAARKSKRSSSSKKKKEDAAVDLTGNALTKGLSAMRSALGFGK